MTACDKALIHKAALRMHASHARCAVIVDLIPAELSLMRWASALADYADMNDKLVPLDDDISMRNAEVDDMLEPAPLEAPFSIPSW